LGGSSLALEIDTYHAALEEDSVVATIIRASQAGLLAHIQLADSNRKPPGHGSLHWADILTVIEAVGYDRWLSIEVNQLPDSMSVATSAYNFVRTVTTGLGERPSGFDRAATRTEVNA
jgi:sugar phosphate isomerase/epimerase